MPAVLMPETDDPVVASYDVYIGEPQNRVNAMSKLLVLQYPAHRKRTMPYNTSTGQKPTSLRLKPETGMVEVEVPLLAQNNFNYVAAEKFGHALFESKLAQVGGSYGLAGGFSSAPNSGQHANLSDIPEHGDDTVKTLSTQLLGGKIAFPSHLDPVYMLGVLRDGRLHMSHVDAVVQMRPQLPHLDAEDELTHRRNQPAGGASGKAKASQESGPAKLETKAIEMKIKDNKEDPKDRHLNENAKLLRKIQGEAWQKCEWIDQDDAASRTRLEQRAALDSDASTRALQSMINNDEWLEKLSAPREEGKKGLRSKLKGRDRERARRKKVESQRRHANLPHSSSSVNNHAEPAEISSESDASSSDEQSEVDVVGPSVGVTEADVKQEPRSLAAAPAQTPRVPDPVSVSETSIQSTSSTAKRRGRPRKGT